MYTVLIRSRFGAVESQRWAKEQTALTIAKHRITEGALYVEVVGPEFRMRLEPAIVPASTRLPAISSAQRRGI